MNTYKVTFQMNGFQQVEIIKANSKNDAETIVSYAFTNATNIVVREA
jgi:hypothetical protein